MAWGSTSYLTASVLVRYVDWRTFADLLSDTGTELASSAAVQADANLAEVSKGVSGMFEVYLIGNGRYTQAQLEGLAGNALSYFQRLLSRMIAVELYDRRPDTSPDRKPAFYEQAKAEFADLCEGKSFLPIS